MNDKLIKANEIKVAEAFSKQSSVFDAIYSPNIIIQYKRQRVREHVGKFLKKQSNILELNSGTGEDAIYFAKQGNKVHATDISEGMQNILKQKVREALLEEAISTEICSFNSLKTLLDKGAYDFIFSNFAGLNCTDNLNNILNTLPQLLSENGYVTMVIMPPFCLWETFTFLKGNFNTAFRRFRANKGVQANVEGKTFTCWYYKSSYIKKIAKEKFDVIAIEGLCTIVPPSYFENFPKKHPLFFQKLVSLENKLKAAWPFKYMGDYFIITLRKK